MKHLKVVRDFRRQLFLLTAELRCNNETYPCVVLDLSPGGARVRVQHALERYAPERHAPVVLTIERCGPLRGRISWQRDRQLGIMFTHEPQEVAEKVAGALPGFRSGAGTA